MAEPKKETKLKFDNKQVIIVDAITTRLSIIKGMGYASAIGYGITIAGLIGSLGAYLFDKDLNGYAILGMFGVAALTIITASISAHQALDG